MRKYPILEMAQYNVYCDEGYMQLLVAYYLAEHNLYKTLYVFKQEAQLETPIYNRQIDLLNQYFVEGSFDDILKFLIQLPQSQEMFELLFKVTQLELLSMRDNDPMFGQLQNELQQYYSLVPANYVANYRQRVQNYGPEVRRQFEAEVFYDLQRVLIPYYNYFVGSECVFTRLPGRRLKQIVTKYYNLQYYALPQKQRPKFKNVSVNLFEDTFYDDNAGQEVEDQYSDISMKPDPKASVTNGSQDCLQPEAKASAQRMIQKTEADGNTPAQPSCEASHSLEDKYDVQPRKDPCKVELLANTNTHSVLTESQHIPVAYAYQKLLRSQYYLLYYTYDGDDFLADVLQFIKYEGLYRIMFSPNGAKTYKNYNLPFDADQVLLTDSKSFSLALSNELRQVAVFDVNFHDAISIKDFSDIVDGSFIDAAIFNNVLFLLSATQITAVDLVDFGVISYLYLYLTPSETPKYFFMGRLPAFYTGRRAIFLKLSETELSIYEEFACKYGDCAVLSGGAMLCNSSNKLYALNLSAQNKVELTFAAAKLIYFTYYCVFGVTAKNHVFSYYYKNGEFLVSQRSVGSQEIVYFQIIGANLFWISQNGLFGSDRLSQFLL